MDDDTHEGDAESTNGNQPSTDAAGPEEGPSRAATDTIHRLLSNERRRYLLASLVDRPRETVTVDDVIDSVTQYERPDPGPVSHRHRVAIDLHHVHLPQLADAGMIEHDPVAGTIRYDGPEALAVLLDSTAEFEDQEE